MRFIESWIEATSLRRIAPRFALREPMGGSDSRLIRNGLEGALALLHDSAWCIDIITSRAA